MKPANEIKIAIVSGAFWEEIVENLERHCIATLEKKGINKDNIKIVRVPGSFEIPLLVKKLAKQNKYDAIITFGAIHKGKTYHFELIANECARACMNLGIEFEVPVIFEVLAVYNIEDAYDRSTQVKDNRGVEAANAAWAVLESLDKV
ncbi:MAG: 6,7-dimethyl-8-ribityllumazine synthase [Candidatus Magasanikbacteria bacterium]|nr:6,7-dimethyl-8-ribityllumazine synthase [Candidatus Magasanikbacteria bacterium]